MRLIIPSVLCAAMAVGASVWGAPGDVRPPSAKAVQVRSVEPTSDGVSVVLAIDSPKLDPAKAKDGRTYTRVLLAGCGNDNEYGLPALPIISHTVEIPRRAEARVVVHEGAIALMSVKHWIYPHQPPIPKVPGPAGDPPFVVDTSYYSGAKAFHKSLDDGGPVVTHFKKRGRHFVNVLVRPFAYDAAKGVLRCPGELELDIAWTLRPLPKAAGPRLGKITVVEVTLGDVAQLDELVAAGYDISGRKDTVVTIYATDAELAALQEGGYAIGVVGGHPGADASSGKDLEYRSYAEVTAALAAYEAAYPGICRLSTLGQSVDGLELWALKITDNPDVEEAEPEIKYVSTMHGDEPVGTEMCLYFIDLVLSGYSTDQRMIDLVDGTEMWIVPLMNPDGLESLPFPRRNNADGYDLNRTFPDGAEDFIGNVLYGPAMDTAGCPPEVVHVMEWSAAHSFVLSANFHTGSLVVNYPYDNDGLESVDSPTPDDLLFEHTSRLYSSQNTPMWNSIWFGDGITNGAEWYTITGGMQDWHYRYLGCNEVTIELSDVKWPPAGELAQFWEDNRESMLAYFESVHMGVRGLVTDAGSGLPVYAAVRVAGAAHSVFTDPDVGDYYRQLLPGTYDLVFSAPGYQSQVVEGVVVAEGVVTVVNAALGASYAANKGVAVVSHESMSDAAAAFRAEKQAQGFDVFDITLTGSPGAETVRGLIRAVYNGNQVDYVIILGDIESVPTFYDVAAPHDDAASDLLYALLDPGEDFSNYLGKDVIVGRVSVDDGAAVHDYVDKLAAFAAYEKHMDLTWISHGSLPSQWDTAEGTHNWVMANALPPGYHNELFYRDTGSAAELTAHINAGTDAAIYSGHGGPYSWSRYDYDVGELEYLTNALDAPIVFGHCCVTGTFDNPTCFAEAWMETTARGIVYVGASANTYWDEDDTLEKQNFQAMADVPELAVGDALAYGLDQVHDQHLFNAQYYFTIYHVFGDPTVSLFRQGPLAIITPPTLPPAYVGEPYSEALAAAGGEQPYTWSLLTGVLPAGLGLNETTGEISGTPTAASTATFTAEVTDLALDTYTRDFSLTVAERFRIVTSSPLPAGVVGQAYSVALEAEGGAGPYTWSLSGLSGAYLESDLADGWLAGGTPQGWCDDDASWPLSLPWSFPFYGTEYSSVYVCSNGFIDFASSSAPFLNSPAALISNVRIAPLWDDLVTNDTGLDIFVTQTPDYVAIRWLAQTYSPVAPVNVELVLHREGDIQFNYGQAHSGLTPTIGVSSGNGSDYTLSDRNDSTSIPADAGSLLAYRAPMPPGLDLSESGVISGVPTETGLFEVSVAAHDAGVPQQADTGAFSLEVGEWTAPTGGWFEEDDHLLLSVAVSGMVGEVSFQWRKDGEDLPGETYDTYGVASLTLDDTGWYSVRVTDEAETSYETQPIFVRVFLAGSLPSAGLAGLAVVAVACIVAGACALRRRDR